MRLPDDLKTLLDASGLPWRIEDGGKHFKIMVCNRLAGILPKGPMSSDPASGRAHANMMKQIRRTIKTEQGQERTTIFSGG
jgi:hypothetical protein